MLKRLAVHVTNYSLGSVLVVIAGLISFPIFTRAFSLEQYGVMSVISTTLLLATVAGKFGMQHSIVRFYAELRAGKFSETEDQFFSTVVLGLAAVGSAVSVLWLIASQLIPESWWGHDGVRGLFALTAGLIAIRVVDSALVNLMRAQQRSGWYSIYNVARRYGVLLSTLLAVFLIFPGLEGFFGGTLVAELLATAWLGYLLLRRRQISLGNVSARLLKSMALFGVPMVAYELGAVVLNLGDRYVIQSVMGAAALGAYSAAYNMCEYVESILVAAFSQAISPMYTRMWEEQGKEATRAFIERVVHFYVVFAVAIVTCMCLVGADLLILLASQKYAPGAVIIPVVIAAMAIAGSMSFLAAGLYLAKQTKLLMLLLVGCAIFNIALNVVLIPAYGLMGAAVATLASYVALCSAAAWLGSRTLPISVPLLSLCKFSLCGVAAYFAAHWSISTVSALGIVEKIAVGAVVYVAAVLFVDHQCRHLAHMAWSRLRPVSG
ncbi:MAG: oligosaccharide flippase family protein [Burkholderiaceae bacterium]